MLLFEKYVEKRKLALTCCGGFLEPFEEENMLKSSIPDVVPHSSSLNPLCALNFLMFSQSGVSKYALLQAIESQQAPASRVIEF